MKRFVKSVAFAMAVVAVLPVVGCYWVHSRLAGPLRAFPGWSQLVALVPGTLGAYVRRAFYRLVLPECGKGAWIGFGTILSHPTVRIGRMVYVGAYCLLGDVDLEDDVLLASGVSIANGMKQHGIDRTDVPVREQPGEWPRIRVGRDSWIGERAVVLADVGQHCVIGAGAVVTRAVPDWCIAVGVPAKVVRQRAGGEG